VNTKIALIIP